DRMLFVLRVRIGAALQQEMYDRRVARQNRLDERLTAARVHVRARAEEVPDSGQVAFLRRVGERLARVATSEHVSCPRPRRRGLLERLLPVGEPEPAWARA